MAGEYESAIEALNKLGSIVDKSSETKTALDNLRTAIEKLSNSKAPAIEDLVPDDCPHMIVFEDRDRTPITFAGFSAKIGAARTFEKISLNWNGHLFVRVQCNTRDDRYPSLIQPGDKTYSTSVIEKHVEYNPNVIK